jgi:hypothetical protein
VTAYTEAGSMSVAWQPGEDLFLLGPAEYICRGSYLPASNAVEPA